MLRLLPIFDIVWKGVFSYAKLEIERNKTRTNPTWLISIPAFVVFEFLQDI